MSFWRIAWKNIRQRGLASSLTALSMALGVSVMVCVIVIHAVTVRQFSRDAQGYHLIVGGNGGKLELVMSTVFHLGTPLYPIPYSYYRQFVDGEFAALTEVAVPYCLGDSFDPTGDGGGESGRLFRVIATTPDLFDKLEYGADADGRPKRYAFREGRNFRADRAFEAVLGSVVATQSGVAVGDKINPTHGIGGEGEKHEAFDVVGVLESTGTANDRAVFVNIEGFYLLDGHALPADADASPATPTTPSVAAPRGRLAPETLFGGDDEVIDPLPDAQREVTSVLVLCRDSFGPLSLLNRINKGADQQAAQAVAPAGEVAKMLETIVGPIRLVLLTLTVLIVAVAAVSILVSIYNSMSERKQDIAVMRALGASRWAVLWIILTESVLLSLAGGLAGIVIGHSLIAAAAPYIEAQAGVRIAFWHFDPWEIAVIPALVVLAALAGLVPAITAYRTDVAASLR